MALPGAVVLAVTRAERDGESAAEALPLLLGDPAPEREKRALLVAQGEAAPLLDAAAGGEKVARSAVAVGGCVTVLIALGVPSPSLLGDAVEVGNKGVVLGFALSDGAPLCDAVALGLALPPPPGVVLALCEALSNPVCVAEVEALPHAVGGAAVAVAGFCVRENAPVAEAARPVAEPKAPPEADAQAEPVGCIAEGVPLPVPIPPAPP